MTRDFGTLGRLRLQVSSQARVLCHVVVFSSYRLPRKTLETTSRDRSRPNVKARGYYTIPLPCAAPDFKRSGPRLCSAWVLWPPAFSACLFYFFICHLFSGSWTCNSLRMVHVRLLHGPSHPLFGYSVRLHVPLCNLPRRWLMTFTEAPEMLCREEWWRPQLQLQVEPYLTKKKKREFSQSGLSRPVASTRYSLSWAFWGNARDTLLQDATQGSTNNPFCQAGDQSNPRRDSKVSSLVSSSL